MNLTPYRPTVRGARATTAGGWYVARRRAWADRALLLGLLVVIVGSAFLAVGVPRLLAHTYDAGAQDAVATAGDAATVRVTFPASYNPDPDPTQNAFVDSSSFISIGDAIAVHLPASLKAVRGATVATAIGPELDVTTIAAPKAKTQAPHKKTTLEIGVVVSGPGEVRYTSGRAPHASTDDPASFAIKGERHVLQVGVSQALATATGLRIGSHVESTTTLDGRAHLVVTGIYVPVDPSAAVWRSLPTAAQPVVSGASGGHRAAIDAAVLVPVEALPSVEAAVTPLSMTGTTDTYVRAAAFTGDLVRGVRADLARLVDNPSSLVTDNTVTLDVSAPLIEPLATYDSRAQAARAQLSVVGVGVVGVAAVTLLLGAQLLVSRRRSDLALEHARGASSLSIAFRLGVESLLVTVLGVVLGAVLATWLLPGRLTTRTPVEVVALVAVLAPPLLGTLGARRAWGRRRPAANRRARARIAAQLQGRQLVAELAAVLVAVASVVALRGRGLLEGQTSGVDALLAAAPLLLALVATLLVLRIYPLPVRAFAVLAHRSRGAVALVSTSRARRALTTLPVLCLTLGVGLAVAAGLLRSSLVDGQDLAAWQHVGAEVRVAATVSDADLAALRSAPGVHHVASGTLVEGQQLRLGETYDHTSVLIVDHTDYAAILADSPLGYRGELARLGDASADGAPVIASTDLARRMAHQHTDLFVGVTPHPIALAGSPSISLDGWLPGPVIIVDRAGLGAASTSLASNLVWVTGPGAEAAVSGTAAFDGAEVTSRADYLHGLRGSVLLHDFLRLLWGAVAAVAIFAAAGLVETIVSGARDRGRTLSLLRTLGLTARQGRWLIVGELAPLVAAGVAAGVLAGVAIVKLLGPALGLGTLTGGLTPPPLRIDSGFAGSVVVGMFALFILAVVVEVAVHRRDRLADTLRAGDRP